MIRVRSHPYIGLQTFTWIIQSEVLLQDSLGYKQIISPSRINLMTKGNGITYTENTLYDQISYYIWHNYKLPYLKNDGKYITYYAHLPSIKQNGFSITLIDLTLCC